MYKIGRELVLWLVQLFSSEFRDCKTGELLGRGLLIGFGSKIWLIGYKGKKSLVPKFIPQKRLTYWRQELGFIGKGPPDFPRIVPVTPQNEHSGAKVMNILVTHLGDESFQKVRNWWKPVCNEENLWVAHGGQRETFEEIKYSRKVFIEDPRIRRNHQRAKQTNIGIFQSMAPVIERESPDYIYLCEYDELPLVSDLNERQVQAIREEGADVMAHFVHCVDGTDSPHALYHESDPEFNEFWDFISLRDDRSTIISMFGSGSLWSREAFLSVARMGQPVESYLEIYLPTLVHHLGFRIRPWREGQHLISNLPSVEVTIEAARQLDCWTVHPIKELQQRRGNS